MKKIKIGLAGLGVVGKGVFDILNKDAKLLSLKSKNQFELVACGSRSKKDFIGDLKFYPNIVDLARDPEIDVIIEAVGGSGIVKEMFEIAIKNGKKIITANKALIAEHGFELAQLVEKYQTQIAFEASVAGATPIIKSFKESFAGNEVKEFYAILNGTCNFILTKMQQENLDFSVALKEAQELGYAEADPTFDIKGIDTAHKLTILAAIASQTKPAFNQLYIEGIDEVSIDDIKLAFELGYKIKLLAIYKNLGNTCQQTVYPSLIKISEKIAQVDGPFNAILTDNSNASYSLMIGRGAGSLPTASAMIGDLVDFANDRHSEMFAVKSENLKDAKVAKIDERVGEYFLRLKIDKNLAQKSNLAEVIFGSKIKIMKSVFIDCDQEILCGFLTDSQKEKEIIEALKNLDSNLVKSAKFLRVEQTNF